MILILETVTSINFLESVCCYEPVVEIMIIHVTSSYGLTNSITSDLTRKCVGKIVFRLQKLSLRTR